MTKLFGHFWLVFAVMMVTAILDLIFIPKLNIGAGFILAFLYFMAFLIWKIRSKT